MFAVESVQPKTAHTPNVAPLAPPEANTAPEASTTSHEHSDWNEPVALNTTSLHADKSTQSVNEPREPPVIV